MKLLVKSSLKFFHAYIREMVKVGGPNFPKTISTKLGIKLGKLYKKRGIDYLIEISKNYFGAKLPHIFSTVIGSI